MAQISVLERMKKKYRHYTTAIRDIINPRTGETIRSSMCFILDANVSMGSQLLRFHSELLPGWSVEVLRWDLEAKK